MTLPTGTGQFAKRLAAGTPASKAADEAATSITEPPLQHLGAAH